MDELLEIYEEMGFLGEKSADNETVECSVCGSSDYNQIANQFSELEVIVCTRCNNELMVTLPEEELIRIYNNLEDDF